MKYKILMIIISMVLVLISCDSNRENINNSELNNEISTEADEEQNVLIEESKMEYVVKPVEKNTEGKKTEEDNETIPDDSLESDLVITKDEIDQYFNFNYDYLKEQNDDGIYCGMFRLLGYTLEFPFISIDGVRLYYANNTDNLLPSYIRLSTDYEIEALRDYGFEKGMSLNDLVRMDPSLKIEDYWIGYQDYYDSFIEIRLDNYVYFLDASDPKGVIWDVYIRREGSNLIDEGYKDILGIWIGENESSKFWLGVLNELKNRGIEDILLFCVDGLTGMKEAINATFPNAEIQRCIIHQLRNSFKYVSYKDLKAFSKDFKTVYTAPGEEAALDNFVEVKNKWGKHYPFAFKNWENNWDVLSPFYKYPNEIRKIIYTTNIIEGVNRQFRKVTKTKSVFPSDASLEKILFLAAKNVMKKWTQRYRNWDQVLNQLMIMYEDRVLSHL